MGAPPRHGHGGHSTLPVRITPGQAGRIGRRAPGQTNDQVDSFGRLREPPASGVLPARLVNEFLSVLPSPDINQISRHDSQYYTPGTQPGDTNTITSMRVSRGTVIVFTDIEFFALAPSPFLMGAEQRLDPGNLAGLLRFELLFSGQMPLEMEGNFISPRAGTNRTLGLKSGWPFVDKKFGVERGSAYGLYAREGIEAKVVVTMDVQPDFPITTIGVEMAGFSVSVLTFSRVFSGV